MIGKLLLYEAILKSIRASETETWKYYKDSETNTSESSSMLHATNDTSRCYRAIR